MFLMINYCNILCNNILIIKTSIITPYGRTEYCNISIYIVSALIVTLVLWYLLDSCRHYRENIAAILLNLVCLMMYSVDIFLIVSFLSFITFLKSGECTWGRVELVLLCLFTVDWLLLVIQVSVFSATENPAVGYVSCTCVCMHLCTV